MRWLICIVLWCLGLPALLWAQEYPLNLENPRNTVHLHMYSLDEGHYQPSEAAKAFPGRSVQESQQLAVQVKQIFDSKGLFLDINSIPSDPDHRDSISQKQRYVLHKSFPSIYLEKRNGRWVYSQETMHQIPIIHRSVFPLGTDVLVNWLPGAESGSFLGLKSWQWMGIGLLLLLAFMLHKIFTFLLERLVRLLIKSPVVPKQVRISVHRAAIPFSYFLLLRVLEFLIPVLQFKIALSQIIFTGFHVAEPVFLTLTLYRIVDVFSLFMERRAAKTETTLDDQLVPLVRKMARVLVVLFGLIWVLSSLNFNITALVAGVSIGGLAFALAAQDTIKNMFGSLMIFVDKPFQVGDWVQANGVDGTVEEVGFRSTRIRTFANSVTYVPNGKIADMIVNNMGMRQYRRFTTNLALTYDTPPHVLETFVEGLKTIVTEHPNTRKDLYEIHVNNLGAHSIDVLFYIFFNAPNWSQELQMRQEMILEIMRLAAHLGVRFAFPTQTLHVEGFPGHQNLTPDPLFDAGLNNQNILSDWRKDYLARLNRTP